jgi:hypothetical protein
VELQQALSKPVQRRQDTVDFESNMKKMEISGLKQGFSYEVHTEPIALILGIDYP